MIKFTGKAMVWNFPKCNYVVEEYTDRHGKPFGVVNCSSSKETKKNGKTKYTTQCAMTLSFFNKAYDKLKEVGLVEGNVIEILDGVITSRNQPNSYKKDYGFFVNDFKLYVKDKDYNDEEKTVPTDPVVIYSDGEVSDDGSTLSELPF